MIIFGHGKRPDRYYPGFHLVPGILDKHYKEVILATGVTPRIPFVAGIDHPTFTPTRRSSEMTSRPVIGSPLSGLAVSVLTLLSFLLKPHPPIP